MASELVFFSKNRLKTYVSLVCNVFTDTVLVYSITGTEEPTYMENLNR